MTVAEYPQDYENLRHKTDFVFTVRIPRILLTPIGIWPLDRSDSIHGDVRSVVQVGMIFVLMCFLLVPHVIYTFHDCEDLTRYMKVIAAQVFSLLGIIKFWTMIFRKKRMRACLAQMQLQYMYVECEEDRLVMKNAAKIARFFTTVYLSLCFGGALPYHMILPLLSEKVVKSDNTTQIPLPYLSNYVFFVIEDSPLYEITFVTQIVISTIILFINCGTNSLIASMTMHSCGMFEVVNRQLRSLFDRDKDEMKGCLRDIVRHHLKAIAFAELIETNLNAVFLTEMVGCTLIICFLEYGVIMEWEDKNMFSMVTYFLLMTWMFLNVYILSYIGDYLKRESEKVKFTSYSMPWYNYSKDVNENLRLIMLRPLRPTCFTAAKFFDLSFHGFCEVSINLGVSSSERKKQKVKCYRLSKLLRPI
ncbi:odorant receptor 82a-like isoform X1 [Nomia melanderi]|uniref:odorant receptor 82a-like isoform X1 n=1 Tax=Nomia melanderi TaxID=2448451 RepID=UPI003FCD2C65